VDALRRFLTWALGGIAVGVAARALTRRPATATLPIAADRRDEATSPPASVATTAPAAAVLPRREPRPRAELPERLQTTVVLARMLLERLRAHTTTVIAGSIAYYALLAVFPAIIAAISIYGLVADPADLTTLINSLAERLPEATSTVISEELTKIVSSSDTGLGIATGIGVIAALWSASAGTKVLITGVNLAYGERETRSYFVIRGLALALTLGMVVGVVVVVSSVAVLPNFIDNFLTRFAMWPALAVLVVVGLAALYRIAPSDAPGRNHPVWQGAFAAAIVWLAATAGFSAGVSSFGSFSATYGALAGVVVLLIWFFLSGLIVLLGAEFNAAIETRRQRLATATG
jgi:membrane protein